MNSAAIRRKADEARRFGQGRWQRFFNPTAAISARNTAALLECIADLNDRVRVLEGDVRDPDVIDGSDVRAA